MSYLTTVVSIPTERNPVWAMVGSVMFRDTLNGTRFTVHTDTSNSYGWITQHGECVRNDCDGPGAYRSRLYFGMDELNEAWDGVRAALGGVRV